MRREIFDHKSRKEQEKLVESELKGTGLMDIGNSLGLIGRLPNFTTTIEMVRIKKCNRYLAIQERRIAKAIENKEYRKAFLIGMMLLKISKSYQVVLFNRVCKGGYGRGPQGKVERELFHFMNKMRSGDLTLLIHRYYILKKSGKGRPIGAPDGASRMVSKAFTDMIYAFSEKARAKNQHGFIKNRGTGSALLAMVKKIKEGYSIYEFDLRSFFNTVEPFIVGKECEKYGKELTYTTTSMLKRIVYNIVEYKPEAELKPKGAGWERFGMPQGLSLSPILCTGALEYFHFPKDLVMYADDGLFFFKNNINEFTRWMEKMNRAGVEVAPEKSGVVVRKFNFLGVEVDLVNQTLTFENSTIGFDDPNLELGTKTVSQKYGKKSINGEGKIDKDAYIHRIPSHPTSGTSRVMVYVNGIIGSRGYQNYRGFGFQKGIYDVTGSSTRCCNELLRMLDSKYPLLMKIKAFNFEDSIGLSSEFIEKKFPKKYAHTNYEGKVDMKKGTYLEMQKGTDFNRSRRVFPRR